MPIEMSSRTITEKIYAELRPSVSELIAQGKQPKLDVVLVGHDSSSLAYIKIKQKRAEEIGIDFSLHRLDENTSEESVLTVIENLNNEETVSGIIIQLPLPEHIDTDKVLKAVALEKDVDGLRPGTNFTPPTVQAIIELLHAYDIKVVDKKIVLVGEGRLVGGPLHRELKGLNLDITICDKSTSDLAACTINADILVSATGNEHLIQPSMVKEGAVIIDVDREVNFEAVYDKVGYITPQKGGVGPLTVAFLLSNVVEAARDQIVNQQSKDAS